MHHFVVAALHPVVWRKRLGADDQDWTKQRAELQAAGCMPIIQRSDEVFSRENGQERHMPERLDLAGLMLDGEQCERAGL